MSDRPINKNEQRFIDRISRAVSQLIKSEDLRIVAQSLLCGMDLSKYEGKEELLIQILFPATLKRIALVATPLVPKTAREEIEKLSHLVFSRK